MSWIKRYLFCRKFLPGGADMLCTVDFVRTGEEEYVRDYE